MSSIVESESLCVEQYGVGYGRVCALSCVNGFPSVHYDCLNPSGLRLPGGLAFL